MKKKLLIGGTLMLGLAFTSCKKCAECHYDGPEGQVNIGEYCGQDLEFIENDGYTVNEEKYEVHCHDH